MRSGQAGAPPPKKRLAEIGQTESKEPADEVAGEIAAAEGESSNSDEEPVLGFLGEATKDAKKKEEGEQIE